jgi:hypothetical protein
VQQIGTALDSERVHEVSLEMPEPLVIGNRQLVRTERIDDANALACGTARILRKNPPQ